MIIRYKGKEEANRLEGELQNNLRQGRIYIQLTEAHQDTVGKHELSKSSARASGPDALSGYNIGADKGSRLHRLHYYVILLVIRTIAPERPGYAIA